MPMWSFKAKSNEKSGLGRMRLRKIQNPVKTRIKGGFGLGARVLIPGSQGPQDPWASTYGSPCLPQHPRSTQGHRKQPLRSLCASLAQGVPAIPLDGAEGGSSAGLPRSGGQTYSKEVRASPRLRKSSESYQGVGGVGGEEPPSCCPCPPPPCPQSPGHIPSHQFS